MKPLYTQLLTPGERTAAVRLGMYAKFAEHGIAPSQIDEHVKQAAVISAGGAAKAVAAVALLTGIPLGIAAHAVGRRLKSQRGREEELTKKIDFYSNATQDLESGLASQPQV